MGGKITYSAGTATAVGTGTAASTVKSIGYVFHSTSITKVYHLHKVWVSVGGGAGGTFLVRVAGITGEDASPGGSPFYARSHDPGDAGSGVSARAGVTNPPTGRGTADVWTLLVDGDEAGEFELDFGDLDEGKSFICRSGEATGLEVRTEVKTALTTEAQVAATFSWTEE